MSIFTDSGDGLDGTWAWVCSCGLCSMKPRESRRLAEKGGQSHMRSQHDVLLDDYPTAEEEFKVLDLSEEGQAVIWKKYRLRREKGNPPVPPKEVEAVIEGQEAGDG